MLGHAEAKILIVDREYSKLVSSVLATFPPEKRPFIIDVDDPLCYLVSENLKTIAFQERSREINRDLQLFFKESVEYQVIIPLVKVLWSFENYFIMCFRVLLFDQKTSIFTSISAQLVWSSSHQTPAPNRFSPWKTSPSNMAQCLMFLRNGMLWKSQTTDNLHPLKLNVCCLIFFPVMFLGIRCFLVNFFSSIIKTKQPNRTEVKTMVHWLVPWIMKNFWLKVIQWPDGIHQ